MKEEQLTRRTLVGIQWTYLSAIVVGVIQIGVVSVMARLVGPAGFGLVAMGSVVVKFGQYFAQMGIGQAIVQKKVITDDEIRAAFTSTSLLGCLFATLVFVLAPLSTVLFVNNEVVPIVRLMALTFLLNGLGICSQSVLRREMRFKQIAIVEVLAYLFGYGAAGVILAISGAGLWSLVVATLTQSLLSVVLSYSYVRHGLVPELRWRHHKGTYLFGTKVSLIGFIEFLGVNLDTLTIGRFFGAVSVGLYNRGFTIVNQPLYNLTSGISRVLFPAFSRIQTESDRFKKGYVSALLLISSAILPISAFIAANAKEIVLAVLGEEWRESIPVVRVLAFGLPFGMFNQLAGIMCDASARLRLKLAIQLAYLLLLGICFFALNGLGLIGICVSILLAEVTRSVGFTLLMRKLLVANAKELLRPYIPGLWIASFVGIWTILLNFLLSYSGLHSAVLLVVESLIVAGLTGAFLLYFPPRALRTEVLQRLEFTELGKESRGFLHFVRVRYGSQA